MGAGVSCELALERMEPASSEIKDTFAAEDAPPTIEDSRSIEDPPPAIEVDTPVMRTTIELSAAIEDLEFHSDTEPEPPYKKRRVVETGETEDQRPSMSSVATNTVTADTDTDTDTEEQEQARQESTCPVCLEVIGKVVESPCGHLFCLKCISMQRMHENSRGSRGDLRFPCPVCRSTSRWRSDDQLPQGWHFSMFLQRKIDGIRVTCPHEGCSHVAPKSEMADHAARCQCARAQPTVPRLTVSLPANGEDLSTAVCPANLSGGDMLELQLEGLRGVHWQCIVPTGVQAGQRFNVRLAGLQGRLAQQPATAADSPAGRPGSDEDPQASVTRVPRPPESDLWRTAWSQRYKRWYWWNTDTLATSWSRPRILDAAEQPQRG